MNWPEKIDEMTIDQAWQWRAELLTIFDGAESEDLQGSRDRAKQSIELLTERIDSLTVVGDTPAVLGRIRGTLEEWKDLE